MPILRNTPVNLKDDDQFLVNRDGTDYQATARRLKRYMHVSMPQEDPVSGQWFHIKNVRGGKLKIKTEGVTPIAVDVLGEAVHAAWYDQIGSYHYGHSIRIFASEEAFDWDKSPWGDVGDLADAIHGDHDEETVEKLISDLGYNRDNFFGTYNHPEYGRGESEFLEILPTSLVAGNGAEVPNNHQYLVYVGTGSIGQRIFQPDRGCTYEIGPLTNTAGITNWNSFFKYESNFVPYLGHIDVSGGTIFKEMFYQAQMGNKPELRCWQVGNGQDFEKMFEQSDFDADLSNWDMSNATNMQSMFRQAKYFSCMRRDIGKWRPNETAKMSTDLFYQCPSLELDVSEWVNTRPDWTEIRNSWNEHTLLRMKDGSLQGTTTSSMCNEPWKVSKGYSQWAYWSALRMIRNPTFGETGELCTERKKLWQGYVDWVDARIDEGIYENWEKARDDEAKAQFADYKAQDQILEHGGPAIDSETGEPVPPPMKP